jgi:prepilin-type N-terminal cleavage/methylation domain-containing protein
MKKEKMKLNSKGFSLVEVLLAIVILGLIAAPVLQMFYTSYQINNKSKRMLNAAELAQTTMEAITSQTYGESKTVKDTLISEGLKAQYQEAYDQRNAPVKTVDGVTYYGYLFEIPFGDAATNLSYKGPMWEYCNTASKSQTLGYLKSDGTPLTIKKEWVEYYFQNVNYPAKLDDTGATISNTNDPLCVIIRFNEKKTTTDNGTATVEEFQPNEVGVVEVQVEVYAYSKDDLKNGNKDTPGYFCSTNLGNFEKLESISSYIPSVRLD